MTAEQSTRYEVITHEDENGDLILPIPLEVMNALGWKENDTLEMGLDDEGRIYLRKHHK